MICLWGGGSITHAAMLTNKYRNFHINDIDEKLPKLFVDAIQGKYADEKRWISREDFFKLAPTDKYVALAFSFGCRGATYAYNRHLELWQKAFHYAVVYGDTSLFEKMGIGIIVSDQMSIYSQIKANLKCYKTQYMEWYKSSVGAITDADITDATMLILDNQRRLRRVQSLQGAVQIEQLTTFAGDYASVPIKPNSVIYCDIPYEGTEVYGASKNFDYRSFYDWCEKQSEPVFVSSYNLPKEKFDCVWEHTHRCTLNNAKNNEVVERLFVPKHQQERGNVGLFGGLYVD